MLPCKLQAIRHCRMPGHQGISATPLYAHLAGTDRWRAQKPLVADSRLCRTEQHGPKELADQSFAGQVSKGLEVAAGNLHDVPSILQLPAEGTI